ncbi:NAD(P)/FAD-dependent oxidoreductase [Micromonospora carbonacea]|uniref:Sarcosine oxidase subunit beta n=1 Tax=Micromonospora carbonacea TaxID=47853 RepID=A0A1C5AUD1_9ACTN|nr:FAD-dependent oxidoreductase [Micromonospora carbonacea]SCF48661.1 sarcosine oxidase subunit beta [Micromonospora carbonacea]
MTHSPGRQLASADVAVLGGGIIGSAVARTLVRRGVDVVLVEAGGLGAGTSTRCDGNVLVQTKHDELTVRLTHRSITDYRRWAAELSVDIRFEQPGSLVFFTDPGQVEQAQRRLEWLHAAGVKADYIGPEEARDREPALRGDLVGAIDCYDDASVYPPAVIAGLVEDARRHGCRVLTGATARRLVVDRQGRVEGVETSSGRVNAPFVVNAMGVWSPQLDTGGHAVPPVRPRQGVLVVTEAAPGLVRRAVTEAVYMANRAGGGDGAQAEVAFVAEPTYRGNILLGSSRRFCGYDTSVDGGIFAAIVTRAARFMPDLARLQVIRSFAGLRPWTPDNKPIVGAVRERPGYILATGHEGEGIGLAPITAELVAGCVLGDVPDDLSAEALAAFSPDRLTEPNQGRNP